MVSFVSKNGKLQLGGLWLTIARASYIAYPRIQMDKVYCQRCTRKSETAQKRSKLKGYPIPVLTYYILVENCTWHWSSGIEFIQIVTLVSKLLNWVDTDILTPSQTFHIAVIIHFWFNRNKLKWYCKIHKNGHRLNPSVHVII